MHKLVTFGSKTSTSLVNNQGSKITPGLFEFSRKTNFSSAPGGFKEVWSYLLETTWFGQSWKFLLHELGDAVPQLFGSSREVLY